MIPERAVVFDTESTGFSPTSGDRLIEIAAIELVRGQPTGARLYGLFWPERAVPDRAAEVHGWTTSRLRGKPLFRSQAADIAAFFQDAELWAHNAAFDRKFLNAEMQRAGALANWEVSCSLQLARKTLPGQAHKLGDLAQWAGHTWSGRAHGAMQDAEALVTVLGKLWAMAPASVAPKTQPKATPKPVATERATPPLAAWTGPVTPANDPRLTRAEWSGNAFASGRSWSAEEDTQLRDAFVAGATLGELADAHGRTPAALALRLERQGLVGQDHPYANLRRR